MLATVLLELVAGGVVTGALATVMVTAGDAALDPAEVLATTLTE